MTFSEIIAILEEATSGAYVLDAEIWDAVAPGHPIALPPAYTVSLDAAASLVPEGCAFSVGCEIDFTPVARVWGHNIHADEFAATPALALCIAALKARSA